MQPSIPVQPEYFQLDALIAKLKKEGESELLIEHLQTATACLHGAMPSECAHNLEMARDISGSISNKSLAGEVKGTISDVLQGLHSATPAHWKHRVEPAAARPAATARGLREFFHGADSSLGIFYPKKHVVAVFRSFELAEAARELLSAEGLGIGEVIAVPGYEVNDFLADIRDQHSLWTELVTQFSRLLDTEANLAGHYGEWARKGAGFVAVYCPTDTQAEGVAALLRPLHPLAMHWFMASFIQHMQ